MSFVGDLFHVLLSRISVSDVIKLALVTQLEDKNMVIGDCIPGYVAGVAKVNYQLTDARRGVRHRMADMRLIEQYLQLRADRFTRPLGGGWILWA